MDDPADPSSTYDNTHRAFLQALLARGTITFAAAQPLLAAIQTAQTPDRPTLANDISREDFDNYVHTLNDSLSGFDFEIRGSLHQVSKEEVFALVNVSSDALTQMSTLRSADEMAFVKRVLDAMFETNNTRRAEVLAVRSMDALKLAKTPGDGARRESGTQAQAQGNSSLTMAQAERVLKSMADEGWFEVSERGFYSLSPRALMELRGWLMDTYNETAGQDSDEDDEDDEDVPRERVRVCAACRSIITVGQRCPNPNLTCSGRLHDHCVGKMFRAQGGQKVCPTCKIDWTDPLPVGEKAARKPARQSNGTSAGNRQQNMVTTAETSDDDTNSD